MPDRQAALLAAIVESSDDAIVSKTLDGVVTFWNRAAERIFGYSGAEMVGRPITTIFPPDRIDEEAAFLERLGRGERIDHYETVRVRKDGRRVHVSVTLSPLRDANGQIVGSSKIARDITERKRAEALLHAQAESWRVTLSSIGDAVIATDVTGRVTFMNRIAEVLTGWTFDEARTRSLADVFTIMNEYTRQPVEHPVARVLKDGMIVGLANHTVLVARGGTERAIDDSAAPMRDESGRITGVVLVFRDVTERRRQEAELQERAAALRQTKAEIELARDELAWRVASLTLLAVLSTRLVPKGEPNGLLLDILDAGIRITGADMGNIQLRNVRTGHLEIVVQRGFEAEFLDFFATVEDQQAACGMAMSTGQRAIVDDVAEDAIFTGTKARGVLLRAGVRAAQSTPLWSRTGELIGMLSTHYRRPHHPADRDLQLLDVLARLAADYIERARMERAADVAYAQLQAADRAKDEFLAMLGHELRNPLATIVSAVGVLNAVGTTAEHTQRASEAIERQAKHLSRLVEDLLDVSRVTTGRITLARQRLDLGEFVRSTVDTWRQTGRFGQYDVSVEIRPAWTNGDPTRIEQIIDNLVANALKYTPSGGRIRLRVREDYDAAVLEVADTGVGIPPPLLDKVFDLFVQADHETDRARGGLGIGLTLVRTLVVLHGGAVSAKSEGSGKGSVFTVRLPKAASSSIADESD